MEALAEDVKFEFGGPTGTLFSIIMMPLTVFYLTTTCTKVIIVISSTCKVCQGKPIGFDESFFNLSNLDSIFFSCKSSFLKDLDAKNTNHLQLIKIIANRMSHLYTSENKVKSCSEGPFEALNEHFTPV